MEFMYSYPYHPYRFCYVEFNDKILIESENIGIDYYINKLPVYNYQGKLLVEYMFNNEYTGIKSKILDIDIRFIKMLGIKNYINPKFKTINYDIDMKQVVNDLNHFGLIILSYHIYYNQYKKRYNLSTEIQNKINNIDDIRIPDINISEHNLTNIHFNIYNNNLGLNECGFTTEPNKVFYKYLVYMNSHKIDHKKRYIDFKIECDDLTYKNKYIKYKNKYINLKYLNV